MIKLAINLMAAMLFVSWTTVHAAGLTLKAPINYQVVQRSSPNVGLLRIAGDLSQELPPGELLIEARVLGETTSTPWLRVAGSAVDHKINGTVDVPAGGWWRLEVRIACADAVVASAEVQHVGVGEVFVVAGQSNSANHGEEKQRPQSGRVAAFDGQVWRLADDPQPGASGNGGSFIPPFADAVVAKEGVPVGVIACGIGATSVREWLPKGSVFPHPPTIERRVEQLPDGQWASKGAAYDNFVNRMKSVGSHGFRAVLWHQGESDANQKDPTRTLPGNLYREYLEKLIVQSRKDIGWQAPWFVAQVSYHVPGDEGSEDIRRAQASLWQDGLANAGPDSDALNGPLRERNGQGVHFSGPGLRALGASWTDKILPWLDQQSTQSRSDR